MGENIAVLDRLEEGEEEKLRPQIEENLGKVTLLEVLAESTGTIDPSMTWQSAGQREERLNL